MPQTATKLTEIELQREAERLVENNVLCCLSSLIATLAKGDGHATQDDLIDLCDQAVELSAPLEDYEEAARQAGYQIRHDMAGFYACSNEEAEHEDAGNNSVGFDGLAHFGTISAAAAHCCDVNDLDPYQWEIYEHWAVNNWLAEKLTEKGERVDHDFGGLNVWGRSATGQAISMDGVIREITRELHAST